MKKVVLLPLLLIATCSFAQYYTNQNKVWAFGKNAGLDFNSGSPVPIATSIDQQEGCASVCDPSGNLLFYTDGKKIYRNTGAVMFSASPIVPYFTTSTSQASLIVPFLDNSDRYYVFSLENSTSGFTGRLAYSVVDMSLGGGLGDVPAASAGIGIEDSLSEKMIAINGAQTVDYKNIWVLVHRKDTGVFLAYEISAGGINTNPVVSVSGTLSAQAGYAIGVLKASPNGRKIVSQSYGYSAISPKGTELYNFDASTGIVSDCIVLDSVTNQYGAEFSPDNTKLYVQESIASNVMKILQYDLSLVDADLIRSSKTEIATITTANVTDMKLAPDHRIYMYGTDDSTDALFLGYSRFLDCIMNPDVAGVSCGYVPHVVQLLDGTGIRAGLPNLYLDGSTNTLSVNRHMENREQVALYPNPANSTITISLPEKTNHISISNTAGKEVYSHFFHSNSVDADISNLPSGNYFIIVNNREAEQFVKQ